MPEPSDTDRIIAAHRDEARRTRWTVVVTLLGIFVGLPVLGLIVWGAVAVTHQPPTGGSGVGSTVVDCPATPAPGATLDLTACPLSGAPLNEDSSCAAFNAAENQATPVGHTNPIDSFLNDVNMTDALDRTAVQTQCALHPDEKLGAAVRQAETPPTP